MLYKSTLLSELNFVNHGFFGRKGGVSESYFSSLNISYSSQDSSENILQNRHIVENKMNLKQDSLNFCYQIHSNVACTINNPVDNNNLPNADSLVTKVKNLPLAIITADCAPVILVDTKQKVVAALHAGWKGALNGIVENTLKQMYLLGCNAGDIYACIGPCIMQKSYEVDELFYKNFVNQSLQNKEFFIQTGNGKYLFSLADYILFKFKQNKLKDFESLNLDTFALQEEFFSHRRMTKNQEPYKGLQCCVVNLIQ